jgi:hypothetical protein
LSRGEQSGGVMHGFEGGCQSVGSVVGFLEFVKSSV